MLFEAVLNAKDRVMLEMNVPSEKLDEIVRILPCMRAPTVAPLFEGQGYAVKSAVKKEETVKLIPQLKKLGATDILEYEFKKVII
jgi:ATP phosphoribosyltransferase